MSRIREPSFRRRGDGSFDAAIPADQRDMLRELPKQLGELLSEGDAEGDPALRRLFPSADPDDPEHASEFDQMVRGDLLDQRTRAIQTMQRTIDAHRLNEDEVVAWLAVVNDLRLVLGTRLGVTEETTAEDFEEANPRNAVYSLYFYLTILEDAIVEALSEATPDGGASSA